MVQEKNKRPRYVQKTYYGNVMLLKKYCPKCRAMSIVQDGRCVDCKTDMGISEVSRFKKKRESITDLARHRPSQKIQAKILAHQNHQCVYCGCGIGRKSGRAVVWDHFIPFVYGETSDHNWIASCNECNSFKSAMLFDTIEAAQIYIQNRRVERRLPNLLYEGGYYEVRKI